MADDKTSAAPPTDKAAAQGSSLEARLGDLEKVVAGLVAERNPEGPQHESVRKHISDWFKRQMKHFE